VKTRTGRTYAKTVRSKEARPSKQQKEEEEEVEDSGDEQNADLQQVLA